MIVLDTNVVSELMRPAPDPTVLAWVDEHPTATVGLTSMTASELLAGVAVLPAGARRRRLAEKAGVVLGDLFAGRILPFDHRAAISYAAIVQRRRRAGRPIGVADAVIAATCLAAEVDVLATRDTRDFEGLGLALVDPWTVAGG